MILGGKIFHFKEIDSTNEYAKTLINTAPEGTIIVADKQKAGKGRMGRSWYSPAGGLYFSIILRPENPTLLSLAIGLAICDVLTDLGLKSHIKWPNDILVNARKISGTLTDIEEKTAIVGIGMNLDTKEFPDDLRRIATSLFIETGTIHDKRKILQMLLKRIGQRYQLLIANRIEEILDDWRNHALILGKEIVVEMPNAVIEGQAIDIDKQGRLLVRRHNGAIEKIFAGDCTIQKIVYNKLEGQL